MMFVVTSKTTRLMSSKRDEKGNQRISDTFLVVAALRNMEQPLSSEQISWALDELMERVNKMVSGPQMFNSLMARGFLERVE